MYVASKVCIFALAAARAAGHTNKRTVSDSPPPGEELPDVDSVLAEASNTVSDFVSNARNMQVVVDEKQKQTSLSLGMKRSQFEQKLSAQVEDNRMANKANDGVRAAIKNLRKGNANLLREAKVLKQRNHIMRELLHALWPKMGTAKSYIQEALKSSEGDASVLQVLEPPAPEPTLDYFLDALHRDNNVTEKQTHLTKSVSTENAVEGTNASKKVSLMQMGSGGKPTDTTPKDFINVLSESIGKLDQAQKEGEIRLQAEFLAHYEKGKNIADALAKERAELDAMLASEQAKQLDLHTAKARVQSTSSDLADRVAALQLFMQKAGEDATGTLKKDEAMQAVV